MANKIMKTLTIGENIYEIVDEQVREEVAELSEEIDSIKAEGLQQTPLFANSIEECTDQSKLYVLPDGYIYAYMLTKGARYNNLADPGSADWLTDTRLSTSSTGTLAGTYTTNYIPCKLDDVIRIKGLDVCSISSGNARFHILNSSKALAASDCGYVNTLITNGRGSISGDVITLTAGYTGNASESDIEDTAYMRFCGMLMDGYTVDDVVITVNEEIAETTAYAWASTGYAFVPADYEDRIIDLEDTSADHESRLDLLEANESGSGVPAYWLDELDIKADAIQQAMEAAGREKSAFLWYTDAHWTAGNAKVSPALLDYLHRHTPMTKTNFGGDIIGDPATLTHETVAFAYDEWRKAIKDLPNHHSVIGNHDNLHKGQSDGDVSNLVYSFLIAPEESPDMVMGGDLYYYIDNPCEMTRYLYLDSGRFALSDAEAEFMIEALRTTPAGWHVVVISHIWFQYSSAATPTVGSINTYMQKALNLFDAYNARQSGSITMVSTAQSYDFTACGGKVEFCIGGHIHVDHEVYSANGIPVIITASDVNQERSSDETEDSGTLGTTTEAAVYGIVADFANRNVSIIGVGRGGSRVIQLQSNVVEVTNYADPTSADWLTGYRLSTSSTSQTSNTTDIVTNYIPCEYGDIVTIEGLDVRSYSGGNARYHMCNDDDSGNKVLTISDSGYVNDLINKGFASVDGNVITIQAGHIGSTGSYTADSTYQRFCGTLMDGYTADDVVITVTKAS